ncbi:MAG: NADH-quinone oxidoreductase subunit NuoK [Ekhidna sp.]|nr:NADH-quinone oxidoreductase subunit NuoK [Ekhidna sp.]MBC6410427.1 NADH-quinone oxidoreductase subunit NuoK [Ekhidna sp.]MBC6425590.1 NADH-quinone oxidoreductase subunit NuoK [Ekhidna sp.]
MNEWMSTYYLYLAALLFSSGVFVVITKKNLIFILIGVELMLNAGNVLLAFFSRFDSSLNGQIFAIFSVVLTVCEVSIALAILLNIYKKQRVSNLEELQEVGNE